MFDIYGNPFRNSFCEPPSTQKEEIQDGLSRKSKPLQVECKYHVIFIPKCRKKVLYEKLGPHLGEVFQNLGEQEESLILEGHLMSDHVHILISIPPAVSQVIGFIKGKARTTLPRSMESEGGTS